MKGSGYSVSGPDKDGVYTYEAIHAQHYDPYPNGSGNGYDGGSNYYGGYQEGKCVHDHDKYSGKTTSQKPIGIGINALKDIITKTSNAQHGLLLSGEKVIDMSKGSIRNEDIGVLVQHLQYQMLNLDKFDVSNNLLGYGAVESLFYTFSLSRSNTALYNIKFMNLSNNYIGDDGAKYIASHLGNGQHPNLRCLDVTGNNLSYEMCIGFSKVVQNISQDIKILAIRLSSADTIIQGGKKQSDLFFGSKEEKQVVIKDYLKQAQNNGIDIQNVVVSKGIFEKIINNYKVYYNFAIGFTKCKIVPKDFTAFAEDKIIASVSPQISTVKTITDSIACYFETFDKSGSSQEGIQFMLDAGFVTTTELLGNVE